MKRDIFIIGSKGIPARYGGFETFVDKLTEYQDSEKIQYHVACMDGEDMVTWYHTARCFYVQVPDIGAAKAVYYDLKAIGISLKYIKKHKIKNPTIYVLACRIGPFIKILRRSLRKLNGKLYLNPDGHEWKREKWNKLIRIYWKYSERLMVKNADLVICDSKNIECYIQKEYRRYRPATIYIPYGAEVSKIRSVDNRWKEWMKRHGIKEREYYLIVGRFVPENNYLTMLKEFHHSDTQKKLVIITRLDNIKLKRKIMKIPGLAEDSRILFVGTVYDKEFLHWIREKAFAYLHGHEVGGTNPSLLEALATTEVNLLLDVGFNREVAEDGALYWKKDTGNLCRLIGQVEKLGEKERLRLEKCSKNRITEIYNWGNIAEQYESLFLQ